MVIVHDTTTYVHLYICKIVIVHDTVTSVHLYSCTMFIVDDTVTSVHVYICTTPHQNSCKYPQLSPDKYSSKVCPQAPHPCCSST